MIFSQSSALQEKLSTTDVLIINLINGIIVMSTYFFESNVICYLRDCSSRFIV